MASINLSFAFDEMSNYVGRRYVNFGFCYVWAWIVKSRYPEAKLYSDSAMFHAFVELEGLCYDSDCPIQGKESWRDLRTYQGDIAANLRRVHREPRAFFSYWDVGGCFSDKLYEVYRNSKDPAFRRKIKKFTKQHVSVDMMSW